MQKISLQASFFILAALLLLLILPSMVSAQSPYLDPSAGNAGIGQSIQMDIKIQNVTSNMNAVAIRLSVPETVTYVSFIQNSSDDFVYIDSCDTGGMYFSDGTVCFDVAILGTYYTNGDLLGTITLRTQDVGTGILSLVDGTELVDAVSLKSYFVTGNIGQIVVNVESTEFVPDQTVQYDEGSLQITEKQNNTDEGTDQVVNRGSTETQSTIDQGGNLISQIFSGENEKVAVGDNEIDRSVIIVFSIIVVSAVALAVFIQIIRIRRKEILDDDDSATSAQEVVTEKKNSTKVSQSNAQPIPTQQSVTPQEAAKFKSQSQPVQPPGDVVA